MMPWPVAGCRAADGFGTGGIHLNRDLARVVTAAGNGPGIHLPARLAAFAPSIHLRVGAVFKMQPTTGIGQYGTQHLAESVPVGAARRSL
jgi:hypothetical protein